MKRKLTLALLVVAMLALAITGCAKETPATEASSEAVTFQYMSPDEVKEVVDNDEYLLLDVRKAEDYANGHVKNSVSADLDPMVSNEDHDTALNNLKTALTDATGSEKAEGKKLVMLCYSGKRYAEAGTQLAKELGVEADRIYTLEGGYKAWNADDLLVK